MLFPVTICNNSQGKPTCAYYVVYIHRKEVESVSVCVLSHKHCVLIRKRRVEFGYSFLGLGYHANVVWTNHWFVGSALPRCVVLRGCWARHEQISIMAHQHSYLTRLPQCHSCQDKQKLIAIVKWLFSDTQRPLERRLHVACLVG